MSFFGFLFFALTLLGLTLAALFAARVYRENRDAALSEVSGGWRIRSQLPIDPGDPYNRFDELTLAGVPFDVMEGEDEGFAVSYFESYVSRNQPPRAGAIVQLPVAGPPPFLMTDDDDLPDGVGPRTAEVLRAAGPMRVRLIPYAVYVRSSGAPGDAVQRTALRLAKAMVADAREPQAGRQDG